MFNVVRESIGGTFGASTGVNVDTGAGIAVCILLVPSFAVWRGAVLYLVYGIFGIFGIWYGWFVRVRCQYFTEYCKVSYRTERVYGIVCCLYMYGGLVRAGLYGKGRACHGIPVFAHMYHNT